MLCGFVRLWKEMRQENCALLTVKHPCQEAVVANSATAKRSHE